MADAFGGMAVPGMGTASTTNERAALLGPATWHLLKGVYLASTASDAGNTPTTELRPGLLLGKVAASGKYEHYQPNSALGPQVAEGALYQARSMIDDDGAAVDRVGAMVIAAPIKASQLLLLDQQARAQLYGRFIFDDDPAGNSCGWRQVIAKTADYPVVAADNNTIFTNQGAAGAVIFTLPAIAKGLRYRFFAEADFALTITAATADTLVVFNDAAADSIAMSTASEIIGGAFEIHANADGTKWLVFVYLGKETQTPVIAT